MSTKLQALAQELVRARGMLQELDSEYKAKALPIEEAKKVIQEKLLAEMAKTATLSTKYEDLTISRKKSVKPVLIDERAAIASLNAQGKEHYVIPTVSLEALKLVEKGSLKLDGVIVETKEYISIRQAKEGAAL